MPSYAGGLVSGVVHGVSQTVSGVVSGVGGLGDKTLARKLAVAAAEAE
jgi:hypothetical protein